MITAYKEASDNRLLWQRKQLEPIYKALFQTTNECGMLVMRYTNKNRVSTSIIHFERVIYLRPISRTFLFSGRLSESRRIHSRVFKFTGAVRFGRSKGRPSRDIGCQSQYLYAWYVSSVDSEMCAKPNLHRYGDVSSKAKARNRAWSEIDVYAWHACANHQCLVFMDRKMQRRHPLV